MTNFGKALVVTHVFFRNYPPYDALEGPYSSVGKTLMTIFKKEVETCQIPLVGFSNHVIYGPWEKTRQLKILPFFGKLPLLKYCLDIFLVSFFTLKFNLVNMTKKRLVVGIDPLSCLPLVFLKKILGYKLIFYSVDFNKNRFNNKIMQQIYKKADEISTRFSDQAWVVCESLKDYKKKHYHVDSFYIPNSPLFDGSFYERGKKKRSGHKMAWTGSFLTERQGTILFTTLKKIQDIKPDLQFYFAPIRDKDKFAGFCRKYGLKKFKILDLHSRAEWQKYAAECDIGIALYDEKAGSTEFIEPLKIWDFMMCGLPFIISSEPSLATAVKKSGVAYFLKPGNQIPTDNSLKEFLQPENIKRLQKKCLALAQDYDISRQIKKALKNLQCFGQ